MLEAVLADFNLVVKFKALEGNQRILSLYIVFSSFAHLMNKV